MSVVAVAAYPRSLAESKYQRVDQRVSSVAPIRFSVAYEAGGPLFQPDDIAGTRVNSPFPSNAHPSVETFSCGYTFTLTLDASTRTRCHGLPSKEPRSLSSRFHRNR